MCKTISIINNKGGVGKTTSTSIMSELLAFLGKKVLVIDLDQQSNLSMMLGEYVEDSEEILNGIEVPEKLNISDLFKYRYKSREDVLQVVNPTRISNLEIIASSKRHKNTGLNITANQTGNNNIILKKALATIKDDYDFILIDNAPANDVLTVNSMFASDLVLVPVRVEGFSYKGLRETVETILYIKEEHFIDSIEFAGAFITQAEPNTNIYKGIMENYREELKEKFLQTSIRKDIKVSEIETNFQPVLKYCPNTNVVLDYSKLILELGLLDEQTELQLKQCIGVA